MKYDHLTLDLFEIAPPLGQVDEEEMEEAASVEEESAVATSVGELDQLQIFGDLPTPERPPPPFKRIYVHFESAEDVAAFAAAIGQIVTTETKRIAFPAGALWIE